MVVYNPNHPIYGGVIIYTVHYFYRLSSYLHHICTSGNARLGNPHTFKYIELRIANLDLEISNYHKEGKYRFFTPVSEGVMQSYLDKWQKRC